MVVRATLKRIARLLYWAAVVVVALPLVVSAFLVCAMSATSWYGEDAEGYEGRGAPRPVLPPTSRPSTDLREESTLPPWTWSRESAGLQAERCAGEWVPGCEPPLWCRGELSRRALRDALEDAEDPRVELTIQRFDHETGEKRSCEATLRPPPGTEFQARHDTSGVVIFGRDASTLYTWQYDLECTLVATRELPGSALFAQSRHFREVPLVPRRRAHGRGLSFATDPTDGCDPECSLEILDRPLAAGEELTERYSEHTLVDPSGVSNGSTDDYIWWAYWNETKWFVHVIDRHTHEPVFAEEGRHEEVRSPIRGVRIAGARLSIEFERRESALQQLIDRGHRATEGAPTFEIRTYDLATGQLQVQFVRDEPLQFDGRELNPRWDERK